jgi:response regulator RpfG family c-di-GMP phosphodiesterase
MTTTIMDTLLALALPERRTQISPLVPRTSALRRCPAQADAWSVARALVDLQAALRVEGPEHTRRVAAWTRALATSMCDALALDEDAIDSIELGAWLHDIGKIAVEDDVLHKPGLYDDHDWRRLRTHSAVGAAILRDVPGLEGAAAIVAAHHEHHDGGGYPFGLSGDAIPIGARLFAVVDAYDAMTRTGPEREWGTARPHEAAISELTSLAGIRYDPAVVSAWTRLGVRAA